MCIFYDAHDTQEIIDELDIDTPKRTTKDLFVVRPGMPAPVVWRDPGTDKHRFELFTFGMVPSWTKSEDDAKKNYYKYFNARDDKLIESRMWKPRFQNNRCLIPANGFFEPHKFHKKIDQPGGRSPSDSVPFYFKLKSTDHFCFAGIYDSWTNPQTSEIVRSYSIITTKANDQVRKIHNKSPRQPVILHPNDYTWWLDESANPNDYFGENIFTPWPDDDMEHWQVSKSLDYGAEGEELIEPVERPVKLESKQGDLF
ncbi:MAG TPA: SOS response-associated peptidase [Balneolaceae bacterium]|nr:SOS response-associated peptidase [Balneolaceae bacterium]